EPLSDERAHPALDEVPCHRVTHSPRDDEAHLRVPVSGSEVDDDRVTTGTGTVTHGAPELGRAAHARPGGKHSRRSGRELAATLATTSREDGATGTRAHAQPETMGLGAAPGVRLEGPLAHGSLQ